MKRNAAFAVAVLALLLAGAVNTQAQMRDYNIQSLDLLHLLAHKPWTGTREHWNKSPRINEEIENNVLYAVSQTNDDGVEDPRRYVDDELRSGSEKRSAVATALNSGRRRRQPAPALGKAVTPYIGVGVLNDVGSFFDSLRDNLQTLASLSPQERSTLFQEPPNVVQIPASGSGGGGGGYGRINRLRPLRPATSRSYNRRSAMETEVAYPGANHHDPALLWTGLGR